jgi:hypothetical protein
MDDIPLISPAIDTGMYKYLLCSTSANTLHLAKELADENADSTNSAVRYAAYSTRIQTAVRAGHRYIAYVL